MTSPIADKHIQTSTGINTLYNNNETIRPSYPCATPGNISFAHSNNDPSNLLALTMINQALNLNLIPQNQSEKQLKVSTLPFQEVQKMTENKSGSGVTPLLISEYQKLKQMIDKSGLLSPNENLVTKNRGECYWSNCYFQSDIEENYKKHMTDCHQLTSSALAQLEISLEKSIQLSNLLIKEQNHLYNMLLHLDQKLKNLPVELSTLTDYHYLSFLLNKFKQDSNVFECATDPNRISSDVLTTNNVTQELSIQPNNHLAPLHQHSTIVTKPILSQQIIDNLSSVLMRQRPIPSTNYQQPIFSTGHIIQPTHAHHINKPEMINRSPNLTSLGSGNQSPNHQLTTIDSNLKNILSQPRSPYSNYPRSDSAVSNHINDKKNKSLQRSTPEAQFSKNITDREYYRQYAVRPSASYVNLIKTAILESPKRELSLNEIYVWMLTEFAYFRDKEQKWKNAIRHNLSLHKCFQRKHGKLWTFNENEYNLKKSRNRFQYNVPITGSENTLVDGDGYDDYEGHNEDNEVPDDLIKKEMGYNDENRSDKIVLDTDEWSKYLHKNSLKSTSSAVDIPLLPNLRADICPAIDN